MSEEWRPVNVSEILSSVKKSDLESILGDFGGEFKPNFGYDSKDD